MSLKIVAAGFASLLVVPVLVIGAIAGGAGMVEPNSSASPVAGVFGDLAADVLANARVGLTSAARDDVQAGTVDPRILAILLLAAEDHTLDRVGPLITGHTYYVKGTTRVSNHVSGRAVDILAVDGASVDASNLGARQLMEELLSLPPELLPDELGGPWVIQGPSMSSFNDASHATHIHAGFDR